MRRKTKSQAKYWWGDSPEKTTDRLLLEFQKMKAIFNPRQKTIFRVGASWDQDFVIITHHREFDITDYTQPIWRISFQMLYPRGYRSEIRHHPWINDTFDIEIRYPEGRHAYPDKAPTAHIISHNVSDSHHRYLGGAICLHGHQGSARNEWNPAKSTAATYAQWTIQWLRYYMYWKITGYWPDSAV